MLAYQMGCALQCQHGHSMVMGWCCTGASWCSGGASNGILQAGADQGGARSTTLGPQVNVTSTLQYCTRGSSLSRSIKNWREPQGRNTDVCGTGTD